MEASRPYSHSRLPDAVQTLSGAVFPRAPLVRSQTSPHMGQSGNDRRNRRLRRRICVDHQTLLLFLRRVHRGDGVAGHIRQRRPDRRSGLCPFHPMGQILLSLQLFPQACRQVRTALRSAVRRHGTPCAAAPDPGHMGLPKEPGQRPSSAVPVPVRCHRRNDTGAFPLLPHGGRLQASDDLHRGRPAYRRHAQGAQNASEALHGRPVPLLFCLQGAGPLRLAGSLRRRGAGSGDTVSERSAGGSNAAGVLGQQI